MTQWQKLLKSLGFSESESTIYLTSLELGPSPVQDIAKKAHVSRVTTYAVIETLADRGLMSSVEKGKKRLFVAESPERLVSFVTSRVKEMESTLKEVTASIDELKLIQRGEKPIVKMFEGADAIKAIEADVVAVKPKTMSEFTNLDDLRALHPIENRNDYIESAKHINWKGRSLLSVQGKPPVTFTKDVESVQLPPEIQFHGSIVTYGDNRVALYTLNGKLISVLIESTELAQTFKALFDYIWYLQAKKGK
ncbi:MAG: helix-turn-helix domain-containing protein [Patescibacteria group bacterium]